MSKRIRVPSDIESDMRAITSSVDLPIGQLIEYVLDGFNRRVAKKVNGVVERYFVYQNQLQIAAELDSSGNLISRYVYGSRANVPDYMIKSGINYRIVSDQLGSVRLVVRSSDGVPVWCQKDRNNLRSAKIKHADCLSFDGLVGEIGG